MATNTNATAVPIQGTSQQQQQQQQIMQLVQTINGPVLLPVGSYQAATVLQPAPAANQVAAGNNTVVLPAVGNTAVVATSTAGAASVPILAATPAANISPVQLQLQNKTGKILLIRS